MPATVRDDSLVGGPGPDTIGGLDGADTINGGPGGDTLYGHSAADLHAGTGNIRATLLADIGSGAVFLTAAPGDEGFVYALRKGSGEVFRIATSDGSATGFLNIPDAQIGTGSERGVLGLAFHPDYDANGRFFVFLTNASGNLEIREYARSANPAVATASPVSTLLSVPHPGFANHNGGFLGFGPDGMLYITTGDGGGSNDPDGNAQNLGSLLGKILRIDVDGDDFPSDAGRNYAIPGDNPFAGATAGADEIWAYGLRNPWRIGFDTATGDLYIADVGQDAREEVNVEPAGSAGGRNYGWDFREGLVQGPSAPPNPPGLVDPVFDYDHPFGESITGGHVYHGPADGLQGAYVFADFVTRRLMSLRVFDGKAEGFIEHTAHVSGAVLGNIASFGTDHDGNLYAVTLAGAIYRLDPEVAAGDGGDMLDGGAGDDFLYGGMRDDVLIGGTGADTMAGGPDNDTYFVDSAADVVIEAAGGGASDWVKASASFDLVDGVDVERLSTTDPASEQAINLYGNRLAQEITGNAGRNLLSDGGRGEADMLTGLAGDDTYRVYNSGDVIVEAAGQGADAVRAGVSYTLKAGVSVEALTTLDTAGKSNLALYGNEIGQAITGNAGSNSLRGYDGDDTIRGGAGDDRISGGRGNDTLAGNTGADTYYFSYRLDGSTNVDTIDGFSSIDLIQLSAAIFTKAGPAGVLAGGAFHESVDGLAGDGGDRIIYQTGTGRLFYDSDGTGAAAGALFAVIVGNTGPINAGDFVIA